MDEKLNRTQEEIIVRTGAENWDQVVEWFGENTADAVNNIWYGEDNSELIAMIKSQL